MKKVLVIDDEKDFCSLIKEMVELKSPYGVVTAHNGAEGIAVLEKERVDLIILDVLMPIMDGYEFFKTIKARPETADIPLIVLTARGAMKDSFEVLDADEFIAKPCVLEELFAKMRDLLEDRVLVVSKDPEVITVITGAFERYGFSVEVVENELQLVDKAMQTRYKFVVGHLPCLDAEPYELIESAKSFKKKNSELIIYYGPHPRYEGKKTDTVMMEWKNAGLRSWCGSSVTLKNILAGYFRES